MTLQTTRLPMAQRLTSRNNDLVGAGTGSPQQAYPAYDSCMVNMYREPQEGKTEVIKRPGLGIRTTFDGVCQGMFTLRGISYSINGGVLRRILYPIPGSWVLSTTDTFDFCDILSDVQIMVGPTDTLAHALIKTKSNMWLFSGEAVLQILTSDGYPPETVRGLAYLDGTFYVMNPKGEIFGSALENPRSWPALNFIGTDQLAGVPRAICRHLNYIVAFTDTSIRMFFNNANPPPGSALSPVGNADAQIGLAAEDSIVFLENRTIFVGKTVKSGRSVFSIEGLSLTNISTPFVDRFLDGDDGGASFLGTFAVGLKQSGHSFYLLTLGGTGTVGITLVGDLLSSDWYVWTTRDGPVSGGGEVAFNMGFYLTIAPYDYFQSRDLTSNVGKLYPINPDFTSDAGGVPINCRIRTSPYDGGTVSKKTFNAEYLIGDTAPTTVLTRYSDNDYQSYSQFRPVSMLSVLKQVRNLGMSRRRVFEFLHTENTPLRLEAVEFEVVLNN